MKSARYVLIITVLTGLVHINMAQSDKPDLTNLSSPSQRGVYGRWLDSEGFVIPGPKTADFIDVDRDKIDDRLQTAPGQPAGVLRPEKDLFRDVPQPDKPILPDESSHSDQLEILRPTKPSRPELSAELKRQLSIYKLENNALRSELKEKLKTLKKPTREQIRLLTAQFQENNYERLAKQKELADIIKEELNSIRPIRPAKPEMSKEVTVQMEKLRQQHEKLQTSLSINQRELKVKLASASREERSQLLDEFRENQKRLNDDIKNVQRKIREIMNSSLVSTDTGSAIRDQNRRPPAKVDISQTGDRRNSDR